MISQNYFRMTLVLIYAREQFWKYLVWNLIEVHIYYLCICNWNGGLTSESFWPYCENQRRSHDKAKWQNHILFQSPWGYLFYIYAFSHLILKAFYERVLKTPIFRKKSFDLFLVDKNRDLVIFKRQNFLVS